MKVWVACTLLSAVTVAAWPIFAWVGYTHSGLPGVGAAAVAAGVCWLGAIAALLLTRILRDPALAVSRVLLGMAPRMGLPLVVGAILHRHGGPLSESHVFGMIVAFYFVTLSVETWLAVRLIPNTSNPSKVTEAS